MRRIIRDPLTGRLRNTGTALLAVAALTVSAALAGCSSYSSSSYEPSRPSTDCTALRESVLQQVRADDTLAGIDAEMQALTDHCSADYSVVVSYISLRSELESFGVQSCDQWDRPAIDPEAVQILRAEGLCTDTPAASPAPTWPDGGLGWNEASNYVGTTQRICGPLRSMRNTEWGVFVNVGEDYPSLGRFTFVIWGDWWMDPINPAATICATGGIYLYEGVTQMELGDPGQLEIWT